MERFFIKFSIFLIIPGIFYFGCNKPESKKTNDPCFLQIHNDYPAAWGRCLISEKYKLTYTLLQKSDTVVIKPEMPFFNDSSYIQGEAFYKTPFQWQYPKISVNCPGKECDAIEFWIVDKKQLNEPLLAIQNNKLNTLKTGLNIINYGWKPITGITVEYNIDSNFSENDAAANFTYIEKFTVLDTMIYLDLTNKVKKLKGTSLRLNVSGRMNYQTNSGLKKTQPFQSLLWLEQEEAGIPVPPENKASFMLDDPEKTKFIKKPNRFPYLIQPGAQRSTEFMLKIVLKKNDAIIASIPVKINIWIPKYK